MVKRDYIRASTRKMLESMETDIKESMENANQRLKSSDISIIKYSNKIYLRATLPKKTSDGNIYEKQIYEIPCSTATLLGVLDAENKAVELRQYLQLGNLSWWVLFPDLENYESMVNQTLGEIKQNFANYYWLNREKPERV